MFDAGDSISRALISANENCAMIDSILLSHFHPDHVAGVPLLLFQMKLFHRSKPLTIYAHDKEKMFLERFILNSYIFEERLGFNLNFVGFNFEKEIQIEPDFTFLARENFHFFDYRELATKYSLPNVSSSFLFRNKNRSLHCTADIGDAGDLLLFEDKNPDYLISEVTHISLEGIIEHQRQKNLKLVFLTHIPDELEEEIDEAELESLNIFAASDGWEFELN